MFMTPYEEMAPRMVIFPAFVFGTITMARSPFLAQARGPLDQALCLTEICNILRRHYRITPVIAFLDIKSAYDTVDRRQIWHTLEKTAPVALISLLQNLFD
jgi:hypothetical protein